MKKFASTPALLFNWIMTGILILLIIGAGFGVFFAQSFLSEHVTAANNVKIDAEVIEEDIRNAKRLTSELDKNAENIRRAAEIVAEAKSYKFQDQIVQDINSYASAAGITVLGIEFQPTPKKTANTLNVVTADVILLTPITYTDYLRFIRLIEGNLTKMQITQLDITSDLINKGKISAPILKLQVYTQ